MPDFLTALFPMFPKEVEATYFETPIALFLLILLPVGIILYRQRQAQQIQTAMAFSATSTLKHLAQQSRGFKRLLPSVLSLLATFFLIVAVAQPVVRGTFPSQAVNLMILLDISLSMKAEDVVPSRIEAAKQAAIDFVDSLPKDIRVGLEFFAGNNYIVQPMTSDHHQVISYLKSLEEEHLQLRTEMGSAIHTAVSELQSTDNSSIDASSSKKKTTQQKDIPNINPQQVIILLGDGDSQEGYPWQVAASEAREKNIAIYTVGIGKNEVTQIAYQGQYLPVTFNENTLRRIAEISGGEYFRVFNKSDFAKVYENVKHKALLYESKLIPLSPLLALLALLSLIAQFALQQWWLRRF